MEEGDDDISSPDTPGFKQDGLFSSPDSSPGLMQKPLVLSEELASSITRDICNGLF